MFAAFELLLIGVVSSGEEPASIDIIPADDTFEENDYNRTAAIIRPGIYTNLQCNDDDWYRLYLSVGVDLTISIKFSHSDGDLDLELYDTDMFSKLAYSHSTSDDEVVFIRSVPTAKNLYIKVYGYQGATAPYSMEISTADITAPQISSVLAIPVSSSSVLVSWTTDESSTSEVRYATTVGRFQNIVIDSDFVTSHSLTLYDLEAFTTYSYMVISTDPNGNTAESDENFFTTPAEPDRISPKLRLVAPEIIRGPTVIKAEATDNIGVSYVEFYLNKVYQHTDYSYEFEWLFDPSDLPNDEFTISAIAYDQAGGTASDEMEVEVANPIPDRTPPEVDIVSTFKKSRVKGENVLIELSAVDLESGIDKIAFYVDGEHIGTNIIDDDSVDPEDLTFNWNTYGFENKKWHTVSVEAFNNDELSASASTELFVDNKDDVLSVDPDDLQLNPIKVTRGQVKRDRTYYEVTLKVKNIGNEKLFEVNVFDYSCGFQPMASAYGYQPISTYDPATRLGEIFFPTGILMPGEEKTLTYNMVPILIAPDPRIDFTIGEKTKVKFKVETSPYMFEKHEVNFYVPAVEMLPTWWATDPIPISWPFILLPMYECDYIITTHPGNLISMSDKYNAGLLLTDMAELSWQKNGVLGYLHQYGGNMIDELRNAIDPSFHLDYNTYTITSGGWNLFVKSDWEFHGYLLIVGEIEIVPSVTYLLDVWSNKENKYITYTIPLSDHYYSDLLGDGGPDVIVGRLIGDSIPELRKQIDTSLGVHYKRSGYDFDGSNALLVSGIGTYYSGFIEQVEHIGNTLTSKNIAVEKQHWCNHIVIKWIPVTYDYGDAIAIGELGGIIGTYGEIVMADSSADKILIYNSAGTLLTDFYHDFDSGDILATGDVWGGPNSEIIISDRSYDKVYIYKCNYYWTSGGWVWDKGLLASYNVDLDHEDKMAVGDVYSDSKDDIIFTDESLDKILIKYYVGNSLFTKVSNCDVPDDHELAVGDLISGGKEEIVISQYGSFFLSGKIRIYDANGVKLGEFYADYEKDEDSIAVDNTWHDAAVDIVLKSSDYDSFYFYFNDHTTNWWGPRCDWGNFYIGLDDFDDMTTGQILSDDYNEILIADDSTNLLYYFNAHWGDRFNTAFKSSAPGKDFIYWAGHGGPYVWGAGLSPWRMPSDLGGTNPFVLAPSCSTGRYDFWEDGDHYDDGIAEAFLDKGAGVYVGATVTTNTGTNKAGGKAYYASYWHPDLTVGNSFTNLERDAWSIFPHTTNMGYIWWRWVLTYNIYGDPKYKLVETPDTPVFDLSDFKYLDYLAIGAGGAGSQAYEMELPKYKITETEANDFVDIPGGSIIIERDRYRVPYYHKSIIIPYGYRVTDIELSSKSELTKETYLNLTKIITDDVTTGEQIGKSPSPTIEPGKEWYPFEDYSWSIQENPNGTTTLNLIVYPFQYNLKTKESEYYSDFDFNIKYIESNVQITDVVSDKLEYEVGEEVEVEVTLCNYGTSPTDVIVSAEVKSQQSSALAMGLDLKRLQLHPGTSSIKLSFNTRDLGEGTVATEIVAMTLTGDVLDKETLTIRVGKSNGEITLFTADPRIYQPGDEVEINLEFKNTGGIKIDATAQIQLRDSNGNVIQEFHKDVNDILPTYRFKIEEHWNTDNAVGKYYLSAIVYYDSKTAISPILEIMDFDTAFKDIIDTLDEFYIHRGLRKSLIAKLENAQKSIEKNKYKAAENQLGAFINEVEAQRSKKLTDDQAKVLITAAQLIIDRIAGNGG